MSIARILSRGSTNIIEEEKNIVEDKFEPGIIKKVTDQIKKILTGKKLLRNRKKAINYNEERLEEKRPHCKHWRTAEEHPVTEQLQLA